jgi:tetratricopeptide (TPR) repeat protein
MVIVDTGSTDNTIQQIQDWKLSKCPASLKLNLQVFNKKFDDFSIARNFALKCAVSDFGHLASYWLLMDADHTLSGTLQPTIILTADCYLLACENASEGTSWQKRLVRTTHKWQYIGKTHEKLTTPNLHLLLVEKLLQEKLVIRDCNDGSSHSIKYQRDLEWLSNSLRIPTSHEELLRNLFHLSRTHIALRQFHQAIEFLLLKLQLTSKKRKDEEIYWTLIHLGSCWSAVQVYPKAMEKWIQAYKLRPKRTEAIARLVQLLQLLNQIVLAQKWANLGKRISFPIDDVLMVQYHGDQILFDHCLLLLSS